MRTYTNYRRLLNPTEVHRFEDDERRKQRAGVIGLVLFLACLVGVMLAVNR